MRVGCLFIFCAGRIRGMLDIRVGSGQVVDRLRVTATVQSQPLRRAYEMRD